MIKGMSYLGIGANKQFQDIVLREHPEGWGIKVFTQKNVFGDPLPFLTKMLHTNRVPVVGLNLQWKDLHNFTERDIKASEQEAKRVKKLIADSATPFLVSGATEHTMSQALAEKYRGAVMSILGGLTNVTYLNQPMKQGALLDKCLNERHGKEALQRGPFVESFDFDGTDIFDVDVEAYKDKFKHSKYFWAWTSQFNLRKTAGDKTPRPQRRAIPTPMLIDATIYLLDQTQGQVNLKKRWILKPKSDQHNVPPEKRALKPVVIGPKKVKRLELIVSTSQIIEVSEPPQSFTGGGWRYYFSERYGFQISEKAKRIQGHPLVTIRADGEKIGLVNMAFRQGAFR